MAPISRSIAPFEIAFDIDGVVANTMESFLNVAKSEFGIKNLEKKDITSYWLEDCLSVPVETIHAIIDRVVHDPFGTNLMPIEGAVEAISSLAVCSTVTFVTARPDGGPITGWLYSILPNMPEGRLNVIATGEHARKVDVLKDLGIEYFVEDNLETCRSLCTHGIKAIVFDQPWNRGYTPYLRVSSWLEIIDMIDFSQKFSERRL
ncbi:MAG: 5' nucleotidase, NT5C type [Dissulfurimicrobium sp.]|uniref:5' nucleotidase, NT5C type n=1 Tax=Dissulfurimicrobium sp. TaxID=2022436 RepID=UPI00404AC183